MTQVRYWTQDVPPRSPGAFSPTMPMNPFASSHGLIHVEGASGTLNVPAPKPDYLPPLSADRRTQSSYVAPDVIRPSIYITRPVFNGIGHTLPNRIPNILPIPALTAPGAYGRVTARQPRQALRPRKIGGRRAMLWPRAFQRFEG